MPTTAESWPPLPYEDWKDTCATLHMWTQMVGKVMLELHPYLNQYWEVGLHLSARGLTSGLVPYRDRAFEMRFDFLDHNLEIQVDDGRVKWLPLYARPVANFYAEFMDVLKALQIDVQINPIPAEVEHPIPFDKDSEHHSYDPDAVHRWWQILVKIAKVMQRYRSTYRGKSSPILLYWGSFDLSEARYSGKFIKPPPGPVYYRLSENEQNVAVGFWPGNGKGPGEAAFYSYTVPAPKGIEQAAIAPAAAYFDNQLGEFLLRYEDVRQAPDPADAVLQFFQSTYEAGATLAGWNVAELRQTPPKQ